MNRKMYIGEMTKSIWRHNRFGWFFSLSIHAEHSNGRYEKDGNTNIFNRILCGEKFAINRQSLNFSFFACQISYFIKSHTQHPTKPNSQQAYRWKCWTLLSLVIFLFCYLTACDLVRFPISECFFLLLLFSGVSL